ncbi:transposase [Jiulongibacter sp. NS-SX5]|uniref:transposase n=1 Tax=Jiulongibacter sp. NS-SX5 TaxID=3463854 RepID=UPI0040594528
MMNLYSNEVFHIYNRGNNREPIFFSRDNYLFFLRKLKKHVSPHCNILAWCLMPNHFHLMIYIGKNSNPKMLSEGFKILLSSYTRAINKQEGRVGSLFTQNTKSKALTDSLKTNLYPTHCFNYIHFNPVAGGLVREMKDWEFSSYRDYYEGRKGSLVNRDLCLGFIEFEETDLPESKELESMIF